MSVVSLEGAGKKREAEQILKKRPVLVLFYMNGCDHCRKNKPAWEKLKNMVGGNVNVAEIESSAVPPSSGVSGFPTMQYTNASGATKTVVGRQETPEDIASGVGLKLGGGRRARRTRRLTRRRRRHV